MSRAEARDVDPPVRGADGGGETRHCGQHRSPRPQAQEDPGRRRCAQNIKYPERKGKMSSS